MIEPKPKPRRRTVALWASAISAIVTTLAEAIVIGEPFIDAILDAVP